MKKRTQKKENDSEADRVVAALLDDLHNFGRTGKTVSLTPVCTMAQLPLEQIYEAAHNKDNPDFIRAFMFLLYSSLSQSDRSAKEPVIDSAEGWMLRASYFGLKYGLPPQPVMLARILECGEGLDLAVAYVRESDAAPVFKVKEKLGIALLDSGMDAPSLISLCRAVHSIEPLSERLLDASEEIELIPPSMRVVEEPKAILKRREQVELLVNIVGDYMLRTKSTKIVILLAGFINTMLASAPLTSHLIGTIEKALSEFLKFDSNEKLTECLKIEIDQDRGKVTSHLKEVVTILERSKSISE